jgi:hypothetical protein
MKCAWPLLWIVVCACGSSGGSTDAQLVIDAPGTAPDAQGTCALGTATAGTGEPTALAGITLLHNQARIAEHACPPLPNLEWDASLAATAASWVAMCQNTDGSPQIIDHNPNRSVGQPYYVGENIFAAGGTATAQGAIQSWMNEKPNYNYAANTCNGVCGHYTQVVWRTTLKIGCAVGNCPNIQFPNSIVCDYGPGGNTGGRPY